MLPCSRASRLPRWMVHPSFSCRLRTRKKQVSSFPSSHWALSGNLRTHPSSPPLQAPPAVAVSPCTQLHAWKASRSPLPPQGTGRDGAACRVPRLLCLLLLELPLRGLQRPFFSGLAVKGTLVPPPRHQRRRQPGQTSQGSRVSPVGRAGRALESGIRGARSIPLLRQGASPGPTSMASHGGQSSQKSRKGNLPAVLSLCLDQTQPAQVPALHPLVPG